MNNIYIFIFCKYQYSGGEICDVIIRSTEKHHRIQKIKTIIQSKFSSINEENEDKKVINNENRQHYSYNTNK